MTIVSEEARRHSGMSGTLATKRDLSPTVRQTADALGALQSQTLSLHVRSSLGGGVGAKYLRGLGEVLGVRLVTKAFQLSPDLRGAFRRGFCIIVTRI